MVQRSKQNSDKQMILGPKELIDQISTSISQGKRITSFNQLFAIDGLSQP